ncbi:hypothetical protein [Chitinophaga sp. GbtcB8]|uniref:hypothetical protein n=1 Tax=Chitinophaga sp. GbtcB8 TaxID=2824753 RepID=UPI001C2F5CFA|nr:hypothetical protein [Chitinophaga sp. GbtcB8]
MTNPKFSEIWYLSMSVIGGPNLLTRPRYAGLLARRINASHEAEQIITRYYTLLPDQLLLLIEPVKIAYQDWMKEFKHNTARDICKSLATDKEEDRRAWYEIFVNRDHNGEDVFWSKTEAHQVASRNQYETFQAQMFNAPVKAGYVNDGGAYPYGMAHMNRAGILYKEMEFPEDNRDV